LAELDDASAGFRVFEWGKDFTECGFGGELGHFSKVSMC
jgi:hypothetical protein